MAESALDNLLIISDLHLSEGWLEEEGGYSRYEDFFYDPHFFAFLRYHQELRSTPRYQERPWKLILNGDTFDFVQVVRLPSEGEVLHTACGVLRYAELDAKRRKFGLGTSSAESVWKLQVIARGHPRFFAALGWFVAQGNQVLFIKGNHDPELYWPAVQAEIRAQILAAYGLYQQEYPNTPPLAAEALALGVNFEPWFYYEAARGVYVEHGGQYEPANHFSDFLTPVLEHRPDLLELPRGVLLTRYVYNALEATHPYADNIRPATRAITLMLRENPLFGVAIFVRSFCNLMWAWGEINRMERRRREAATRREPRGPRPYQGLPVQLIAALQQVSAARSRFSWQVWGRLLVEQLALGWLSLLGVVAAIVGVYSILVWESFRAGFMQLFLAIVLLNVGRTWEAFVNADARLDYMPRVAQEIATCFREVGSPLRYVFLGHSHIPQRSRVPLVAQDVPLWLMNTGAWISMASRDAWGWETCLAFGRLAAGAAPGELPELLEWDMAVGEPHYPLHWARP